MKRKVTKQQGLEIAKKFAAGKRVEEIAKEYGIVPRQVYYYTKPRHKKARKLNKTVGSKKPLFSTEDHIEFATLLLSSNFSADKKISMFRTLFK